MVMGDLGAEVIKIEPLQGDNSRMMSPFTEAGESYSFAQVNRNKRSVVLDLTDQRGRQVLLAIAARCDFVIENFRPGTAARLGCDFDSIRAIRPDVVYCSISGFGQSGPYARRPAYDIITQGLNGFLTMTGHPGGSPAKFGIAINDIAGGTTAVQAMLAAHIARLNGRGGQYIDISLLESGLAWTVWEAAALFGSGEVPTPVGTRHRRMAPYQAYRTRDGYVTLGANTDRMWKALCRDVLHLPGLVDDARYASQRSRVEHGDELEAALEKVLVTQTTEHWVEQLLSAGIPAGPVYTYDQTMADPQLKERGAVAQFEHATMGTVDVLASPLRLTMTPPEIRLPAPRLGEHTRAVLMESGVEPEVVDQLQADGVIVDSSQPAIGSEVA
jgi:crotonobetainyl-CoA:carnitine CoA-transferase CaiB-like acyl-CoA transferase